MSTQLSPYYQPDTFADNVRDTYWDEGRFPVDAECLARREHVEIRISDEPGLYGCVLLEPGRTSTMALPRRLDRSRRRVHAARMLSLVEYYRSMAVLRGESPDDTEAGHVWREGEPTSSAARRWAVAFANQLLMPDWVCRDFYRVSHGLTVKWLARYFGVPKGFVTARLRRIGITWPDGWDYWGRPLWRKRE